MDFNDGNWRFRGSISVFQTGKAYSLPWSFSRKNVAIDASFRQVKPGWYRAGYVGFESNGLQIPNGEPLSFGRSVLTSPDFPDGQSYRIKFTPVSWLGPGRLKCWEFIPTRKLTRPEPIDLTEFTTQEIELLIASGLDPAKLRLSPESLEIVLPLLVSLRSPQGGSILTEIKTLIQDLQAMAQSDTRAIAANLSGLQTALTNTQQAIVAQFVTMGANMVQEFRASLNKADFVQSGSVYLATVTHTLNNASPQLELFDAQGDAQGLAQLIAISATQVRVELTTDQWNDNSYPLRLIIQGTRTALATNPVAPVAVPGTNFAVRYNPGKSGGALEWSDNAGQSYTVAAGATNVKELYLSQGSIFSLDDSNAYKVTVPGTWTWNPSDAAAYAIAVTGTLIGKRAA